MEVFQRPARQATLDRPRVKRIDASLRGVECVCVVGGAAGPSLKPSDRSANAVLVANAGDKDGCVIEKQYLVHWQESRWVDYFDGSARASKNRRATATGSGSKCAAVQIRNERVWLSAPICSEIAVPECVRKSVLETGVDELGLIVSPANERSLSSPDGPRITHRQARWRAIENRRSVVRCAPGGISGVIDPQGRVLETIPFRSHASVYGVVSTGTAPLRRGFTIYTRYGEWIGPLAGLYWMLLGFGAWANRRRRRFSKD